ncbi:MAG: SPASM domain-containing protein, partial [Flammeovirgaceae bacterium]|nr:SPASM domain-containing protein [Flammeovirgaceae bacterium]MDW8288541.1 SPASM domain-containing protein [Flammeovirgaceae bacterium]
NFSAADAKSYLAFHPNRKEADYEKMINNLKEIASKSELKLVCVICKTNVGLIEKMIEIASTLKASIQFKLMSTLEDTQTIAIDSAEKERLLAQKETLLKLTQQLSVKHNLLAFFQTLQGKNTHDFPIEQINCYAGYWYARVWADGSLHYCCNPHTSLRIGSLYEKPFKEWWTSSLYQSLRQKLKDKQWVSGCEKCGKFDLNYRLYAFEQSSS